MTIEKRGNSYRIKEMKDKKMYSVLIDHKPTKREAEKLIQEAIDKKSPKSPRMTFEDAYNEYISMKSNVLSPSTLRGYRGSFNGMPEDFKKMKLQDIDQIVIQKLVNDYSADHSPKTTRNMHGLVTTILNVFFPDLVFHTTLPQKSMAEPYIPTEEEVKKIFNYVKGTPYECAYALSTLSLRRSEICAASAEDLEGNVLHIHKAKVQNEKEEWITREYNKNDTSTRDLYLPDHVAELIRQQGCAYSGNPWTLNQHLETVLKKLEITKFSLHKFRHFFASYAHSIGMSDADIMKMGGWKTDYIMKSTYRHAQKVEESQAKAVAYVNGLLTD